MIYNFDELGISVILTKCYFVKKKKRIGNNKFHYYCGNLSIGSPYVGAGNTRKQVSSGHYAARGDYAITAVREVDGPHDTALNFDLETGYTGREVDFGRGSHFFENKIFSTKNDNLAPDGPSAGEWIMNRNPSDLVVEERTIPIDASGAGIDFWCDFCAQSNIQNFCAGGGHGTEHVALQELFL